MFRFVLNGRPESVSGVAPTTTLLEWLRGSGRVGTKEGCAEGDCGACTVAFLHDEGWRSVNACLVPLPAVADREVVTVEGLASEEGLHPAQSAMVEALGSQCGYCTPGFVMSLFEATYRQDLDADWKKADQICGNLCRCTGYRPIQEALEQVAGTIPEDDFRDRDAPTLESFSVEVGEQRFYRPGTLAELYEILGREPQARLVAGATDLGLDITKKGVRFPCLVSLEGLPLAGITNEDGTWRIGATTTLSVLEAAEVHPALNQMLRFFASRQIKNRATVGGNLCNASPIGDLAPVLMALEAKVVLASALGERRLLLEDFFLDYRQTAMLDGEVLTAVEIREPAPSTRAWAHKVCKRREMDISAVCLGVAVSVEDGVVVDARLAYGGMAATTRRAEAAEEALLGQPWTEATVRAAMDAVDFTPFSDHRGSAWYRGQLARNLLLRFWELNP